MCAGQLPPRIINQIFIHDCFMGHAKRGKRKPAAPEHGTPLPSTAFQIPLCTFIAICVSCRRPRKILFVNMPFAMLKGTCSSYFLNLSNCLIKVMCHLRLMYGRRNVARRGTANNKSIPFRGSSFSWSSITTKKKRQIEIAHVELFQSQRWQPFSAVWNARASFLRGLNESMTQGVSLCVITLST